MDSIECYLLEQRAPIGEHMRHTITRRQLLRARAIHIRQCDQLDRRGVGQDVQMPSAKIANSDDCTA